LELDSAASHEHELATRTLSWELDEMPGLEIDEATIQERELATVQQETMQPISVRFYPHFLIFSTNEIIWTIRKFSRAD
jgi:hypothetical protein